MKVLITTVYRESTTNGGCGASVHTVVVEHSSREFAKRTVESVRATANSLPYGVQQWAIVLG